MQKEGGRKDKMEQRLMDRDCMPLVKNTMKMIVNIPHKKEYMTDGSFHFPPIQSGIK